jgi:sterol desaturase/sphingolipid hydroxylase (fatty acid hydroxylase superfamily)
MAPWYDPSVSEPWALLERLAAKATRYWFSGEVLGVVAGLAVFAVFALVLEARAGRDTRRRYLSPSFRTDATYMLFAVSGLYTFLCWKPVYNVLETVTRDYTPVLRLDLFMGLPTVLHFAVFTVMVDFVRYWKHRWMHSNPYLWAFHSVHHTQQELTFLTTYRSHVVDLLLDNAITFGLALLFGMPATLWLSLSLAGAWLAWMQHSDLDWSYGKLDRVLVSPRFHSVHHSTSPEHYDRHFGFLMSVWDRLFGTAEAEPRRPAAYGVPGLRMSESFLAQLVFPFRELLGGSGSGAPAEGGRAAPRPS